MSGELFPVGLALEPPASLTITWSDGVRQAIRIRTLRDACPCAHCRREPATKNAGLLPVLAPAELRPLTVERMVPVGQYAYGIHFSDGHSSGVYTWEWLRGLGERAGPPAEPLAGDDRDLS